MKIWKFLGIQPYYCSDKWKEKFTSISLFKFRINLWTVVKLKVIAVTRKRKMPVSQLVHGLTLTPKFLISNFIWKCLFRQIILYIFTPCTTIHDIQNGTESLDSIIKSRDQRTARVGDVSSRIRLLESSMGIYNSVVSGPKRSQIFKFFWSWSE